MSLFMSRGSEWRGCEGKGGMEGGAMGLKEDDRMERESMRGEGRGRAGNERNGRRTGGNGKDGGMKGWREKR